MRTIHVSISTGYVGCILEDTFEVEDDATESEINEIALDVMHNLIEWNWYEKDN